MIDRSDQLADALWTRLRNVLIALDRIDRLESATDFAGWTESFQRDETQIMETARVWVLRAVHLASDPLNYQILCELSSAGGMSIAQLMQVTGLPRVDVTERVKDLAQVGYVAQAFETDSVQPTPAAQSIVAWLQAQQEQIAQRARAGLMKDNPAPKLHRRLP